MFLFPRNCIGQNFALNEMKVATALTLKRYELVAVPNFKPKLIARVVLRSVSGVHIKLRSIKKQKWEDIGGAETHVDIALYNF